MTLVHRPHWPVISEADFKEFLGICPDYRRTSYTSGTVYRFASDDKSFAEVHMDSTTKQETVFIHPDLLK